MEFSLRLCHARLLRCTHIGHLLQAEEPRHLCNPMLLDKRYSILAICQPSGQGRWPGPLVPSTQVPPPPLGCSVTGIPGKTLSTSLAFPALAMLWLPLEIFTLDTSSLWEGAQAQPPMPPKKAAPDLPSPSSPGQGAVGHLHCSLAPAPTFPRQHSPGDMHCLPPCHLTGQHSPEQEAGMPGQCCCGGTSSPSPTPARAIAHTSYSPQLPQASGGLQLCRRAPGSISPFPYPLIPQFACLDTLSSRNHVCLSIYKTSPSCCFTTAAGQRVQS